MIETPYFPLFLPIREKHFLLYGAGTVGQRRLSTLLPFRPKITVIAEHIPKECYAKYAQESSVSWHTRAYIPGEIKEADFVLAATSSLEVNHAIYRECREKNIPVNNASCQAECDFFFPAVVQKGEITIGLCSGGQNHTGVRETAALLRQNL